MNLKSLVKETIKEVVVERQINLFVEKNTPTNPSKWSYYKSQAKKKFDVYPSMQTLGQQNNIKQLVVVGERIKMKLK